MAQIKHSYVNNMIIRDFLFYFEIPEFAHDLVFLSV